MKLHKNFAGIGVIEAVFAVTLFLFFVVGSMYALENLSKGLRDINDIFQAEQMAKSTVYVTAEILERLSPENFADCIDTEMVLSYNGSEYELKKYLPENFADFGPINSFSLPLEEGDTPFFRKIVLTQKRGYDLFEIRSEICVTTCDTVHSAFLWYAR